MAIKDSNPPTKMKRPATPNEDHNTSTGREPSPDRKQLRHDSPEFTSHISVVKIVPTRDKTIPEPQTSVDNEGGTRVLIQNRKSSVTTITSDNEWLPSDMDNLSAISTTTRSWVGDSTAGEETANAILNINNTDQNHIKIDMLQHIVKTVDDLKKLILDQTSELTRVTKEVKELRATVSQQCTEIKALKSKPNQPAPPIPTQRHNIPQPASRQEQPPQPRRDPQPQPRQHPPRRKGTQQREQSASIITAQRHTPDSNLANIPGWGGLFHKRRVQYRRQYLNREKANILQEDLERNPLHLRKKYRPPPAHNANHHKILERKSIETVKADIDELRFYEAEASENCHNIDLLIEDKIKEISDPTMRETMRVKWSEEVSASMPKSEAMCHRNLNFLSNLYKFDPYHGYTGNQNIDSNFQRGPRQRP